MIAAGTFTEVANSTVTLLFSEAMAMPVNDLTGVSVQNAGTGSSIATGISANDIAINIATATTLGATDYVKVSFDSSTGNITDTAGNKPDSMAFYIGGSGDNNINASAEATGVRIEGNAGADTLTGSSSSDVIIGGTGADDMTGGSGADVFVFASDATGAPSATNYDTIQDWNASSANDVIAFGGGSLAVVTNGTSSSGVAAIDSEGIATFNVADDTLAKRITAVEAGIATGTAAAGQYAVFEVGSDSYLFISDGSDGVGANDVLIQLAGVTGLNDSTIIGGVLSLTTV